jgi:hypothetical protein
MEQTTMALEAELKLFSDKLPEWLGRHEGKYVLIKNSEVAGFFESAETAFENGVDRWGNAPMLIKRVVPQEPVERAPALYSGLLNVHP